MSSLTPSGISYFSSHLDLESFFLSMTQSHSFHVEHSTHDLELFYFCDCDPMFRAYSRHVLWLNLWSFSFCSSVYFTSFHSLFVFYSHSFHSWSLSKRGIFVNPPFCPPSTCPLQQFPGGPLLLAWPIFFKPPQGLGLRGSFNPIVTLGSPNLDLSSLRHPRPT